MAFLGLLALLLAVAIHLLAVLALGTALRSLVSQRGQPPTPFLLLLSYVYLLPAFGLFSCWGNAARNFPYGHPGGHDRELFVDLAWILGGITIVYVARCIQVTSWYARKGAEGKQKIAGQPSLAVLGIVVTAAMSLTVAYALL